MLSLRRRRPPWRRSPGGRIAIEAAKSAEVDETSADDVQTVTALLTAARETVTAARVEMLNFAGLAEKADGVAAERARSLVSVPKRRRPSSLPGPNLTVSTNLR